MWQPLITFMTIQPIRTKIFQPRQDLVPFLFSSIPGLREASIICITSKIVALSQGRLVKKSEFSTEDLIKKEAEWAVKTRYCWLTLKDGIPIPNAGIDESNAQNNYILWPDKPAIVAAEVRAALLKHFNLKRLGILITDSKTTPLRNGITGVALGYAGFKGLRSYIGKPDIFGRKLEMSQTNVADSLATAAGLVMGEAAEQTPLAIITDAPVDFTDSNQMDDLSIPAEDDMYRPLIEFSRR